MKHATPSLRYFAGRLMVHAARGAEVDNAEFPTALPVIHALRPHLAALMGSSGFDTLVARALALARGDAAWLSDIQVESDGTLKGFDDLEGVDPAEITRGSVVLIASLLGLLVAFVGEILTLHLVRDTWPDLPHGDDFTQRDDHEKKH